MNYNVISDEELKILTKNKESRLVRGDLEIISGEQDIIIKYLKDIQNNYRIKLANLQAVGKEGEIYIGIKTIEEIINGIKKIEETLRTIDKK